MLCSIYISNFVIIKEAKLDFKHQLNIITGETGSGKSLIFAASQICLGAKANAKLIRQNCSQAEIRIVFQITKQLIDNAIKQSNQNNNDNNDNNDPAVIRRLLQGQENQEIIEFEISKIIFANAPARSYLNQQQIPLNVVTKISEIIIDCQNQHGSQTLLNPSKHIEILDNYSQNQKLTSQLNKSYQEFYKVNSEYLTKQQQKQENSKNFEQLSFILEEYYLMNIQDNEDEELSQQRAELKQQKNILEELTALQKFFNNNNSPLQELNKLSRNLQKKITILNSSAFEQLFNAVENAQEQFYQCANVVNEITSTINFNEQKLIEVEQRLFDIKDFLRKNRTHSLSELKEKFQTIEQQKQNLHSLEKQTQILSQQVSEKYQTVVKQSEQISKIRCKKAQALCQTVNELLPKLNLDKAVFDIEINRNKQKFTATGFDKVNFLVSTNPKMPMTAINKTASGGELSRLLLAIKIALSHSSNIPTFLLDEIDDGVSGSAAASIATQLKNLSNNAQVIVITHSAQIAALKAQHYGVEKKISPKGLAISEITEISNNDHHSEIAKMLSGHNITQEAKKAAQKLIDQINS